MDIAPGSPPRSETTATKPQLAAATPATPNLASTPISLGAFGVEAGQLPGLVPIDALQSGPAATGGQPSGPAAASSGPPIVAIQAISQAAAALQNRPVELTLQPEELGRVRLTLRAGDGSMAVAIAVERPETLDLLRRHIDQLANQLRDIGYQNLTFEFAGQGQQFGDRDFGDSQARADDKATSTNQTRSVDTLRLIVGADSGLDIRV
jgi:flagellar hook-length control protein FliK